MMYVYSNKMDAKNNPNRNLIVRQAIRHLRAKGIATKIVSDERDVKEKLKSESDCLLIPYSFPSSFHSLLVYCNQKNIPVITMRVYPQYFPDCTYNTITRYPYGCMRSILAYFIYNKGDNIKISYFGMSPNTLVDTPKMNALYSLYSPMEKEDFYFNDKGISECFERFFERRHEYDAVVCANSHVAVAFFSLLNERDPETAKKLMVVSFLDTKIAEFYHTPITISAYYENSIYDAVATMYKNIKKQECLETINFNLKTRLIIRESSGNMLCPPEEIVYDLTSKYYFGERNIEYKTKEEVLISYVDDPCLRDVIAVDNLLDFSDDLNLRIIWLFLNNYKNSDVSAKLYISIQTVQYRAREMFKLMNVKNKSEFIRVLSKYISVERLKRYILDSQSNLEKNQNKY